jgi:hypothetical protein
MARLRPFVHLKALHEPELHSLSPYRAVNTFHLSYKTSQLMLRSEIIDLSSVIFAEYRSTLFGHIEKILNINLLKPTGYLLNQ